MGKSIKKNYIYNLLYQLLIIIMPIITTPYLSRTLGSEGIGTYGYTLSIVTYFILFGSLGISIYGQREIAYYQDKKKKISKIFWELLIIRFFAMFISGFIFYFCFCLKGEFSLYYKILLLELFATTLDISWFFQGIEEFKKIVVRNFAIKILSVILIFSLVKSVNDVSKYIIIYVLTNVIGNLSLWFNLRKYVVFIKINFKELIKHFIPLFSLFIPQIAIQIYTVLDKTMIGIIMDDMNEVGFYEQSQKIVKLILTIITSLAIVMVPRISNLYKNNKKDEINSYMNKAFSFVWLLSSPLVFGLIAISKNFVPFFFGNGFDEVILLLISLSPIICAIGFNNLIGMQYLISVGKQRIFTISVTIGAIINLVLNIVFINVFGTIGACISTVIAETSILFYQIYYIKKNNDFDISYIYKVCLKYLISGITMSIIVYCVGIFLRSSFISLLVQVIIGIIVYFIMLFLLKDSFFLKYFVFYKNKLIIILKKWRYHENKKIK